MSTEIEKQQAFSHSSLGFNNISINFSRTGTHSHHSRVHSTTSDTVYSKRCWNKYIRNVARFQLAENAFVAFYHFQFKVNIKFPYCCVTFSSNWSMNWSHISLYFIQMKWLFEGTFQEFRKFQPVSITWKKNKQQQRVRSRFRTERYSAELRNIVRRGDVKWFRAQKEIVWYE